MTFSRGQRGPPKIPHHLGTIQRHKRLEANVVCVRLQEVATSEWMPYRGDRRMDRVVWRRHDEGGKLFSAERWPLGH